MPPRISPRTFMILTSGLGIYGTTVYASYHLYRIHKLPTPPATLQQPAHQKSYPGVFDALASEYDTKIGWDEWLMRLGSRRKELVGLARGSVLEVSAGTGRNLEFYAENPAIKELCMSDVSESMLMAAYKRFVALAKSQRPMPKTEFKIMDVQGLAVPTASFDTVIDTFGLCSCSDPVAALKEMARCCKPDGKVLLLEHGRGHYQYLNEALDKTASDHAVAWGCWWNRDIEGLVKEAGLDLLEMRTYHFGTTLWMVAKPITR
ncbi:S-adenosyl-L-methionine-dependent methyltransferase [Powellomyces hirtus]|nr:S-adenosyl-L-methionine-dependent methyltransferase [Powellomyces hirtus]